MSKTYKTFTNFDVFVISKELNEIVSNGTIANIYEVEDLLILKIQTKGHGKKNLIIKRDSRINLTEYDYPIPKFPSQYIMSLRKFLKNRRILSVSQYKFDRIIIFELNNNEDNGEPWKFIIELFNKGNFLLLNDKNILKIARKYKKFKDRDILANREYTYPISRGIDFISINKDEFRRLLELNLDVELVRFLARNINIAGIYSEEICHRAGIDKKTIGKDLNENNIDELFNSLKKIRNDLLFGEINANIILTESGDELSVIPIEIQMFSEFEKKKFETFNSAVDDFFSKLDSESIKTPHDQKINAQIKSQEKILKNQLEYMEELKSKKEIYYIHGDFIYANFNSLEKLLYTILDANKKGYNWDEINNKLINAKHEKLEGSEFFVKIIPATKQLIIRINEDEVYLNLKKSLGENANIIYAKGKKAGRKIKGTIPAMEEIKKKIEKLTIEKESMEAGIDFLVKRPKKKWYEKFLWFESSDEFLIVGGRDATSNEILFKKYLDPHDIVFHTNFPGSPLTIIKNPDNKQISNQTLQEAAIFVASFSRAWKETWGVVDVFYVQPDQVSKSPPSGEFLPKGSFMITGKKNMIKNAKTELAIGLKLLELEQSSEDDTKIIFPKIIYGPINAIKKQTEEYIVIAPTKTGLTKGKLAKEIKSFYLKNSNKDLKKWINLLSLDEILLCLPSGNSVIKQK